MTSDFFLEEADIWRDEAWDIIRKRTDVKFFLLTKRPQRVKEHLPADWGEGWENVMFNVTCENQRRADERIPILLSLPFRHKGIMCAPFIGPVTIREYLPAGQIEQVLCDGENYGGARPCHYEWILALREQCVAKEVAFRFHQTGARFVKDGRMYRVKRCHQLSQAHKANIDYKIGKYLVPEMVKFEWKDSDYHE